MQKNVYFTLDSPVTGGFILTPSDEIERIISQKSWEANSLKEKKGEKMQAALIVKKLKKNYTSVTAVENLTFEIDRGEIFGLLGHNGAGKTTSIECILGTKLMDNGIVEVLGMNPRKDRKKLFEKVGVQFQQTNYQDKLRVGEVCELTASLYQNPSNWKELLKTFGLTGMEHKMVAELSGGERQKLSVLQALIPNPELVFLDELTTGLDSKARREVWKLLEDLNLKGLNY